MLNTISRLLSVIVAILYVIFFTIDAIADHVPLVEYRYLLVLLFPLALIWFPDELGSATGFLLGHATVDIETPGWLVAVAGWFFLIILPILIHLLS